MTVDVPIGPGSATWDRLGQWRLLLVFHRSLVLQASHPAVGAAVNRFSVYNAKPWRRLFRTLESLQTYVYGSASEQRRELARLERLHRRMHGSDDRGREFDAGDVGARAWVHLTLFEAVLTMQRLGGDPLAPEEAERFYAEWLRVGAVFGLAESDLPPDVAAFEEYFEHMVTDVLEDNPTVRDLLSGSVHRVPPPPGLPVPALVWAPLRYAVVSAVVQATAATLPPVLRERLRLTVVPGADLLVSGVHHVARYAAAVLPKPWRYLPLASASIRATSTPKAERVEPTPESFFRTVLDQTGDGVLRWSDLLAMSREISTHLDLDEDDENLVHTAFESWWTELCASTGTPPDGGVTFPAYRAAVAEHRYPAPPDPTRGLGLVAATVRGLIDRDDNGEVRQSEYARLLSTSPRRYELVAALRDLDRDGDGTLHSDEFEAALTDFLTGRRDLDAARYLLGRI